MEICELGEYEIPGGVELLPHQEQALEFLDNGKILYGGVGAGKSLTALAYYMEREAPRDIYVITTAKKRDDLEWMGEAAKFGIGTDEDSTRAGILRVDSWNNISKYEGVDGAFFVFDEQRLVGHGAWVKSFLRIAKKNRWILLTATPGDVWLDYAPVFIANGWYKNLTEFKRRHVRYEPFVKFPKVLCYLETHRLDRLRNEILVEMPYLSHTTRYVNFLNVGYDPEDIRICRQRRWNPFSDAPIADAAEYWRVMRRLVYSHTSRLETIRFLRKFHPRLIIFYNFDYELEILRALRNETVVGEWNGHVKSKVPTVDEWVYLVQYTAGSEGWNCTTTDACVLYSLTYSYKNYVQAQGRIDRLDTLYSDLYYYILTSSAIVDVAVKASLANKKSFNENKMLKTSDFSL